jgi:hypothetical protein
MHWIACLLTYIIKLNYPLRNWTYSITVYEKWIAVSPYTNTKMWSVVKIILTCKSFTRIIFYIYRP